MYDTQTPLRNIRTYFFCDSSYDRTLMFSVRDWVPPLSHVWPLKWRSCPCSCHEYVWGSRGITPLILNLEWRWVVSFTPRPLYSEKEPPVFTEEEAGCAPEPPWTLGEERNPCPYQHSNPGPSSHWPSLHPLTPDLHLSPLFCCSSWWTWPIGITWRCKFDISCPHSFANVVQKITAVSGVVRFRHMLVILCLELYASSPSPVFA